MTGISACPSAADGCEIGLIQSDKGQNEAYLMQQKELTSLEFRKTGAMIQG